MPTPTVVATLPFEAARATKKTVLFRTPEERATLLAFRPPSPHDEASSAVTLPIAGDLAALLDEACDLARGLGCEVRRRLLGGAGGGYRWVRGRMRIVLDVEATESDRLAVVADALRGEPRLAWVEMSDELAEYLQPRRAA